MVNCKGCEKRHPGCHSICPEYIGWKSDRERRLEKERKKRHAELEVIDSKVKQCEKVRRNKRRW